MTTLQQFLEGVSGLESIWYVSTAARGGVELTNDEDGCDLNDVLIGHPEWLALEGETTDGGRTWQWDGEGRIFDEQGNSILNLKVFGE